MEKKTPPTRCPVSKKFESFCKIVPFDKQKHEGYGPAYTRVSERTVSVTKLEKRNNYDTWYESPDCYYETCPDCGAFVNTEDCEREEIEKTRGPLMVCESCFVLLYEDEVEEHKKIRVRHYYFSRPFWYYPTCEYCLEEGDCKHGRYYHSFCCSLCDKCVYESDKEYHYLQDSED